MHRGHICYLANAASIHTLRWANYFTEHNWKVDLITWRPPGKDAEINANIDVHRILFPPHYIARYGALLEIALLIRKIRPDIIHAHYISHFGILAGLYGRLFGFRPIVLTAWGRYSLTNSRGLHRQLQKLAIRRADCITCDAEHIKEPLMKLGADPKKIRVIYFGTDTRKFSPRPKSEKLKEQLGVCGSPVVISLRNLQPLYDVESLIKAVPLVLKEIPSVKFIIAGDGEQKEYLYNLATLLAISENIRFVGQIANDELPQYLNMADIYVSTSLSDAGLAASTAEAMACGLPVVITDFGDNRKWVEDNVNGFVVPLQDPETLASQIICLLRNKDDGIKFGQAGRQIIEERNNYEKEMVRMGDLYEMLIKRHKKNTELKC